MDKTPIETAEEAHDKAVEWQNWQSEQDLSYDEVHSWQVYFVELAERFDLTEEFKENGII